MFQKFRNFFEMNSVHLAAEAGHLIISQKRQKHGVTVICKPLPRYGR
jgi:hypothetical protein